jgi:hypothetical protein
MATFSIGEAVKSGFDLIRRNPKVVTGWGVLYFAFALVPAIAAELLLGEGENSPGVMLGSQTLSSLSNVTSTLLSVVLAAAICRVMLRPESRSHWYLGFGLDELWVGLVSMAVFVPLFLLGLVLLGPVLFALFGAYMSGTALSLGGVVLVTVWTAGVIVLLTWLAVRFSLAAPMSFDRRTFVLLESWSLTRGRAWRIFLAYAASYAILLVIQLLALAAFLATAAVLALPYGALEGVGFKEVADRLPAGFLLLVAPPGFLILTALSAISYPITIAPAVTIYRRLSERDAPEPA